MTIMEIFLDHYGFEPKVGLSKIQTNTSPPPFFLCLTMWHAGTYFPD